MRLTEEQALQDDKRYANCNALAELKYCGWDIPHRKSITNDEIHFYAWLCRSAVALLKEQQPKKSRWMSIPYKKDRICERCGHDEPYKFAEKEAEVYQYCPHCGAKMETETDKKDCNKRGEIVSELDKLEEYLKNKGILHKRINTVDRAWNQNQIIVYDKHENQAWDAICHRGSYGYEQGLLEIYGNIVDYEKDGDSVVGWLTAEDVIKRIEHR